jgi:TonB family protein
MPAAAQDEPASGTDTVIEEDESGRSATGEGAGPADDGAGADARKLSPISVTATLWLSIDPEGHVLDFRIEQSSGHSILDSEVEDLVRRADPVPPVPETMQDASIEFVVPVQFVLR